MTLRFSPKRPRSRRGGRRPGAGAPPGNLNALKHGRRSAQFAQLGALLATLPEAREALLALARRHQLKQRKAEEVATLLLSRMMHRSHQMRAAHPEPVLSLSKGLSKDRTFNPLSMNDAQSNRPPPAPATPNTTASPKR